MTSKIISLLPKVNVLGHPFVRQIVPYVLLWGILFGLLLFVDGKIDELPVRVHLVILLGTALVLGIFNWYLLQREILVKGTASFKTGMTVLVLLFGVLIFWFYNRPLDLDNLYSTLYLPALTFFAFPWLFALAFQAHFKIPALKYASIQIEGLRDMVGKVDFAGDNTKGIQWIFGTDFHEFTENGVYSFRTFTPHKVESLELTYLFKGLLAFHNVNLQPNQPINLKNCSWEFYHQSWLFFPVGKKALNPLNTIGKNNLRFRKLTSAQRKKMGAISANLPKDFRFATIYIKRLPIQPTEIKPIAT